MRLGHEIGPALRFTAPPARVSHSRRHEMGPRIYLSITCTTRSPLAALSELLVQIIFPVLDPLMAHKMTFYCIFSSHNQKEKKRKPSAYKNTTQESILLEISPNIHFHMMPTFTICFVDIYVLVFHLFDINFTMRKRQHAGDSSTFKNTYKVKENIQHNMSRRKMQTVAF